MERIIESGLWNSYSCMTIRSSQFSEAKVNEEMYREKCVRPRIRFSASRERFADYTVRNETMGAMYRYVRIFATRKV